MRSGLLALFLLSACASSSRGGAALPAEASAVAAFRFDAARVPVGRVVHYIKTNIDGSKPALVSIYFASNGRIEVYKSEAGLSDSAEVDAEIDWENFSPRRIAAGVIRADGSREARASLEVDGEGRIRVTIGDQQQVLAAPRAPFHVFNFDLMSLNATLPHLVAPEAGFTITLVEPTFGDRPGLIEDRGPITLAFAAVEQVGGAECRKYTISGPGLRERGGALWVNARDGLIERVESPLANNPDWDSYRLERRGEETMTPAAWEEYRRTHVGTGAPK